MILKSLLTLLLFVVDRGQSWQSFKWLLAEVLSKEAKFYKLGDRYIREVMVGFCVISYKDLVLYEVRQVFKDGRETARYQPVGGKLRYDQDPEQEMLREIEEEIGISPVGVRLTSTDTSHSTEVYKFPGTEAVWHNWYYEYQLEECEYSPEGYIEVDRDKTTYFKWFHKDVKVVRNSGKWTK